MVRETEMVREVGGRRRYLNKDGDLEINNAPCVIGDMYRFWSAFKLQIKFRGFFFLVLVLAG